MNFVFKTKKLPRLDPRKFQDPEVTADGGTRAQVGFRGFDTLWFNTGTLCNLTCSNCYIESSPTNDRFIYLTAKEVSAYLDELQRDWHATEVGFTGGEPFMNKEIVAMLEDSLRRGYRALVLTNAMKPMTHHREALLALRRDYGDRLTVRVSIDHYTPDGHEFERGEGCWPIALDGLKWLSRHDFRLNVAGRTMWSEDEAALRDGYKAMFAEHGIKVDADDPGALILFPEMDELSDVPEITTACWDILGKRPEDVMCANSRMVVHRKGKERATVLACTLLPYDLEFDLGKSLADASVAVSLNHPHCAKFCVLGGGSCSAGG